MNEKGFTFVELVISIAILTIAVIGIYNAFAVMIILTSDAINRLTAAYLSQEGIEIVRNIRDYNWLNSATRQDWRCGLVTNTGITSCDNDCTAGCEADYKTMGASASPPLVPWAGGHYLYITGQTDQDGHFYGYDQVNATKTKFKRKITIVPLDDHIKVTVQVFWDEKPNIINPNPTPDQNSITAEEYLYNWY